MTRSLPSAKSHMPYRIEFKTHCLVSTEIVEAQIRDSVAKVYPLLEPADPHEVPLAIVGGGPSAKDHLQELLDWPGEIWALNMGAKWLASHGRTDAILFTVDPDSRIPWSEWTQGVGRAIVSTACHSSLFEAMKGKDVRVFHCRHMEDMPEIVVLGGGRCSASRAVMQAAWRGFKNVTFYGCEGSIGESTHAYRHEEHKKSQMIIQAGDREYITTPDLYFNTEDLVRDFREQNSPDPNHPYGLREKSGGLLRAMLEHPDTWEIVALSEAMLYLNPEAAANKWDDERVNEIRRAA